VQFINRLGFVPSKEGWKKDVFQLAQRNIDYPSDWQKSLFLGLLPLQRWYMFNIRKKFVTSKDKDTVVETYRNKLQQIRSEQYSIIEAQCEKLVREGLLIEKEPEVRGDSAFSERNIESCPFLRAVQVTVIILMMLAFWSGVITFYSTQELINAVRHGINQRGIDMQWYDWAGTGCFALCYVIYYHVELWESLKSTGKSLVFFVKCCKINSDMENKFELPQYDSGSIDYDPDYRP